MSAQVERLNVERKNWAMEKSRLDGALADNERQKTELSEELQSAHSSSQEHTKELQLRIAVLEKELHVAKESAVNSESKLAAEAVLLSESVHSSRAVQDELAAEKERVSELEGERTTLRTQLDNLRAALEQLQARMDAALEEVKAEKEAVAKDLSRAKMTAANLEGMNS